MSSAIEFVVNGQSRRLTTQGVETTMAGVDPEPIRSHQVLVGGVAYPVKQVFELATGLDRLDFTSATARRHLARLGFTLSRTST